MLNIYQIGQIYTNTEKKKNDRTKQSCEKSLFNIFVKILLESLSLSNPGFVSKKDYIHQKQRSTE